MRIEVINQTEVVGACQGKQKLYKAWNNDKRERRIYIYIMFIRERKREQYYRP